MKAATVAVVAALALAAAAYAGPGAPDSSLGRGGTVTIDFPLDARATEVLRQPDGKLVVIGTAGSDAFAIARYAIGGALDPSFGAGGRTLTELGSDVSVREATIEEDGRIVVTGTADGVDVVARYDPDGSLDPTFGDGGIARGGATTAMAPSTEPQTTADAAAVTGSFATDFKADEARPLALEPVSGQRILVAGSASVAGVPHLALGELDADGSPVASFGEGGRAIDPLATGAGPASVDAAAVESDGSVVVAGPSAEGNPQPGGITVSRYGPDGSIDESFGTAGSAALPATAVGGEATGMTIEPDGRIVVVGSGRGLEPTALTPAGRLDPAFGRDQRTVGSPGDAFAPEGVVAAGQGLLVYGESGGRIALARYRGDGALDRSFGQDGIAISRISAFDAGTERAAIEPDGRIVFAGSDRGRFAIARFGADGEIDPGFGEHGEAISDVRGTASAVGVSPDDEILVAGSPANADEGEFAIARFDGSGGEAAAQGASPAPVAAAEPRRPRHAHSLGAPHPVPAWYVNASNLKEMKQFAAQDACKFARSQPRSAQRTLILDFGGARAYGNGSFGAAVNNATFEATNDQILAALRTAADAYAACHRRGRATIAYANTNHFSLQSVAARARRIGVHQAKTVVRAGAYVRKAGYAPAVGAGVAGDVEPGYWGPRKSKALVNGAKSVRRHDYMDFGTAGGCPPYLKGQHRPKHRNTCLNDWTLDDVAHVSNSGGGEPLPEIYYRGGRLHYDQAAQWGRVARSWNSGHETPYTFLGATGSTEFSSLTPSTSWKRLKKKTTGHVGRELLNFRQDHGPTLTAAPESSGVKR